MNRKKVVNNMFHSTCLSGCIQSISEVVLAIATVVTMVVVVKYAIDTNRIAANSTLQLEASFMPFVTLVIKTGDINSNWMIKNQGAGTAINIHYTRYLNANNKPIMQWLTPLAPGQEYSLSKESDAPMRTDGFQADYQSLNGIWYRTIIWWRDGDMKIEFKRVQ